MTSNRDTAQSALGVFLICTLMAYAAYFVRAADRIIITGPGMYYTTSWTENFNLFLGCTFTAQHVNAARLSVNRFCET